MPFPTRYLRVNTKTNRVKKSSKSQCQLKQQPESDVLAQLDAAIQSAIYISIATDEFTGVTYNAQLLV